MAIGKLYTVKEAADILGVSTRSIFRYIQPNAKYQLKASKIGSWRIRERDLEEFLEYKKNA